MQILFYSPDSYGLGHVRRTVSLAGTMLASFPGSSALVLTGAPRAHYFAYPPRCDYLKLPSITKDVRGNYVSGELDLSLASMVDLRGKLVREASRAFRPDVFLVDHAPCGLAGEVLPTLAELPRTLPGCRRVLGLRDVVDEPEAVRRTWEREGVVEVLRRDYDRILVYGQRDLFDPIAAYGLPADVAAKIRFVGYVGRPIASPAPSPAGRPFVLVTVGGGGDGKPLAGAFIDGYRALGADATFDAVVVTGPLMSPRKRRRLARRAFDLPGLRLVEHVEDLPGLMAAAAATVSMAGYNTVCELAAIGARAVLVPRVFPRREQWVRARALAARGAVACLDPATVTSAPASLIEAVRVVLDRPRPRPGWGLAMNGLDGVAEVLGADLPTPVEPRARSSRRARREARA